MILRNEKSPAIVMQTTPGPMRKGKQPNRDSSIATEPTNGRQIAGSGNDEDAVCVHSANSAYSVRPETTAYSVRPEPDQMDSAIRDTVRRPLTSRNSGPFRFSRKLHVILGRNALIADIEDAAKRWYEAARPFHDGITLDQTICAIVEAYDCTIEPDDNTSPLDQARDKALVSMECPQWLTDEPPDSESVKLGRLILEMDKGNAGGTWYLSCHDAARFSGLTPQSAARRLKTWARRGILEIVTPGKQGPPGNPATRYRLLARETPTLSGSVDHEQDQPEPPEPNSHKSLSMVQCGDCGSPTIPAFEVNGWRNWDCPQCGKVNRRQETK